MLADDVYGIDSAVNRVVNCGAGSVNANGVIGAVRSSNGDNQIVAIVDNIPNQNAIGRWGKVYNFGNIYDKNLLTTYGQALEADLSVPLETTEVQVYDPNVGVKFAVGDYIALTSTTLGWNNTGFRIMKEHVHFDASGHEQVTLDIAPVARLVSFNHTRRKALEYILNSQTANNSTALNSVNLNPSITQSLFPNIILESGTIAVVGGGTTGHFHMSASICGIYNSSVLQIQAQLAGAANLTELGDGR